MYTLCEIECHEQLNFLALLAASKTYNVGD